MAQNFDDLKGRAKEAAGDMSDDDDLQREGKIDRGKGSIKEKVANVTDKVGDKLKDITR